MTPLTKLSPLSVSLIILILSALPALAEIKEVPNQLPGGGACGFPGGPPCAGANTQSIINFLNPFIDAALFLIGTLAVIFLVYAGIKYISSRGDEEEAKRAKMQIAYAVIGLVVALGARTIKNALLEPTAARKAAPIISLIIPFISTALFLVGTAAVIFLIYAGFKYISSRGDEEEAKQAKNQIAFAVIGITVALLAVAITNFAILALGGTPVTLISGAYSGTIWAGIINVVNAILTLVGIAAAIFLVYAGVKYISSTGDEEEAGQAKRQIVYAIIGLTVVGLSVAIANLIITPLGGYLALPFAGTYAGTVEEGIRNVVNALLGLVGIAAAIFLVYAGVKYITSQGDEEVLRTAKTQIIYALIGLVVIGLSAVIVNIVLGAL